MWPCGRGSGAGCWAFLRVPYNTGTQQTWLWGSRGHRGRAGARKRVCSDPAEWLLYLMVSDPGLLCSPRWACALPIEGHPPVTRGALCPPPPTCDHSAVCSVGPAVGVHAQTHEVLPFPWVPCWFLSVCSVLRLCPLWCFLSGVAGLRLCGVGECRLCRDLQVVWCTSWA